jgi:uncharacterized protein (DUF342 family)
VVNALRNFLRKYFSFHNIISIVRPTPLLQVHQPAKETQSPSIVHGTVSVVNGEINVKDPEPYGSFATISIPDDPRIEVMIDGNKVSGRVVVSESHTIEVTFHETEPSVTYDISVSDDSMSVSMKVNVVSGSTLKLKDTEPVRHLTLAVEEVPIPPEPISPEKILDLLKERGFKGHVDYTALNRLCYATVTREEVIIHGTPPRPGRPVRFQKVLVPVEADSNTRKMRLSTVSTGTTIAVFEPEIAGLPGRDVYGNIIQPETKSVMPTFGSGVIEVNGYIVAARDGRLVFTKKRIDVVPEYVIEDDLTAQHGEIIFEGNVVVIGAVLEGASVNATGAVTVYGSVKHATIRGEHGVTVTGHITGSRIWAGHRQWLYTHLASLVKTMIVRLERFLDDYRTMVEYAMKRFDAYTVIPQIPTLLLDRRYPELDDDFNSFIKDDFDQLLSLDISYRSLYELIRAKWQGIHRASIREEDIQSLLSSLKEYLLEIESTRTDMSIISALSVTSSMLYATGNILIKGKGSVSSTLESGNSISVSGHVRGGFLTAKKAIYVGELGNPYGIESSVRVTDKHGVVRIKTRYPNTVVEVNGERNRCYDIERNVRMGGENQRAERIVGR